MNIKTGLTALLLSLPLLANAGAREELMALEATKTTSPADAATITTSTPAVPAPGSLMLLPDGRRANMKEYAVVLFMQAHCQYSAKFDPLLKGWADEHAIRVYPYRGPVPITSLRLKARKAGVRHLPHVVPSTSQPHASRSTSRFTPTGKRTGLRR